MKKVAATAEKTPRVQWRILDLVDFVQSEFAELADEGKAAPMAAYMKTDMPFYGIQKPMRIPVYKEMKRRFIPASSAQYNEAVLALWHLPHREEKYAALEFVRTKEFMTVESFALYEQLIREGAWWDLVDDIAVSIVSEVYLLERNDVKPIIERWILDDDMWIRRTAILAHNHHKAKTDSKQLFAHILKQCDDREFFIRKAIGWALREYSYANPAAVINFIESNKDRLSALSYREGAKALIRNGHFK